MSIERVSTLTDEDREGALEVLEEALELARNGDIRAVAVIIHRTDNAVLSTSSKNYSSRHALIAGCEYLKIDLIEKGE